MRLLPPSLPKINDPSLKTLLWATLLAAVAGIWQIGAPIDLMMQIARGNIQSRAASGNVVIVAVDDKSVQELNAWPWPRRYHAALLDRLTAAGAREVAFDDNFETATNEADDSAFAEALARTTTKVSLAARFNVNAYGVHESESLPLARFRSLASMANTNMYKDDFDRIARLPLAAELNKAPTPSMAARLSGITTLSTATFPIDFSIALESIPTISAIELLKPNGHAYDLRGKSIIVGSKSSNNKALNRIPGHRVVGDLEIQALGAETLANGTPIEIPWYASFLVVVLAAAGCRKLTNPRAKQLLYVAGVGFLAALPFCLTSFNAITEIAPAFVFLAITGIRFSWQAYAERSSTTNSETGLPNLNALARLTDSPDTAMIVAKIRNFSEIMAMLPRDYYPELIASIARRLVLSAEVVALYQGDEGVFAWLVKDEDISSVSDMVEGLHSFFLVPVQIGPHRIDINVNFGIDRTPNRSTGNRYAAALLAAEEAGAAQMKWKEYDSAQIVGASWKLSLASSLDEGIDKGQIWVAFQPKLDLRTGAIVGAEALARWTHPEKGEVGPADFVAAAEANDRVERLSAYIFDKAIAAAAEIVAEHGSFNMAVNLSARLVDRVGTYPMICEALERYSFDPHLLTVELTETARIANNDSAIELVTKLRALGIKISIDDYGTGLANLNYISAIPADEIKIDRSFVGNMRGLGNDREIVKSTIDLAHQLGRVAVAEGIEDAVTLADLQSIHCDVAQGFFISRPIRLAELTAFLRDRVENANKRFG
jgi:diguanylate cyclase